MSGGTDLLLATRSLGKLHELRPMFRRAGFSVVDLDAFGLPPEPEEDGLERFETFEENALAKARYFYEVSGGIATVADDSGLEVAALGGRPGVRSKRWSGRADLSGRALDAANNAALVSALGNATDRHARYVCAAAYVGVGHELVRRGEVEGRIVVPPRGTAGFGYDPYFEAAGVGRTFGEVTEEEKERLSHRGRAFRALIEAIRGLE